MGNTLIQTSLVSPGQVSGLQNLTDNFAEQIKTLIKTYVPGLPNFYRGLRPIESEDINIPCVMLQPLNLVPSMSTTAKFHKLYAFDFWYVVGAETVDKCTISVTDVAEIFVKLFSNNALNDRATATPTNQFKTYGTNWVDSEMSAVEHGAAIKLGRPTGPTYVAVGHFQLKLETQKLV